MDTNPLKLTREQIDGDNPVQAAYEVVRAHITRHKTDDEIWACLRQLPQHWRAVYTTIWMECEVLNGGHHQFFWNSDGVINREVLEDLKLISAQPFVLLFEEALDVYEKHDYEGEKREAGLSWEAFTEAYREKRMTTLDEAFFKAPMPVSSYLEQYLRANAHSYSEIAEPCAAPNGGPALSVGNPNPPGGPPSVS